MLNQVLRVLVAIGLASTAACTQQEPEAVPTLAQIQDGFAVKVSADAKTCTVGGNELTCVELPAHLSDILQVPRSRYIVLSDSKIGRTDNGLGALVDALHKAGYGVVWSASLIMERE